MNKKILPILIAAGMLVLSGCGPSGLGYDDLDNLAISNKTEIQAAWLVGETERTLTFTTEPEINVTNEINNGHLVVTSSDVAVASVVGRVIMALSAGTATISVSYAEHVWDTVEVTISARPEDPDPIDPDPIEGVLLAKYDLADVVRTPYGAGGNTKYAVGEFATFLSTKVVAGGTDNLASSSGETNVYYAEQSASATGPQFNGIKFGSSSAGGSVTLTFDAGTNITKVVVGCAGWATPNTDTLSVGGVVKTPVQGSATATVEEVVFDLSAASDSIAIVTNKRIVINFISVYVAAV